MKKLIAIILGFILVGATTYFVGAEVSKDNGFVTYEEIIKRDKMAVVYIYSESCTYCHEFFPIFKELSQEFKHKFLFSTIDVYDRKYYPLFRRLRIQGVPAIYLYNPQKKTLNPIAPYYYTEQHMRKILTKYSVSESVKK